MSAEARSRRPFGRALLCAGFLAPAAALALPAAPAFAAPPPAVPTPILPPTAPPAAPAAPAATSLTTMLARLQSLYLSAEQATESYDATQEKLGRQRALVGDLDKQLAGRRSAVQQGMDQLGVLARQQYQNEGMSPYARLLLSTDPTDALSQAHELQQAVGSEAALVSRLRRAEQQLSDLTSKAHATLDRINTLAGQQRKNRDDVNKRLSDLRKTVASLTRAQLAGLARLQQQTVDQAQQALLASGRLGTLKSLPSVTGEQAIAYALAQLGKAYVWGAQGPGAFDCSGLTSQAWLHAGRTIPRTSQEQWSQLRHVPLNQLRPGDLVIYYPTATHVAMYLGNGLVVEAPHPGGAVEVADIAADPILGAVRPDDSAPSVSRYRLPSVPGRATGPGPFNRLR